MPVQTKTARRPDAKQREEKTVRSDVAEYYGFSLIQTPVITREMLQEAKSLGSPVKLRGESEYALKVCPEEKVAVLRQFSEETLKNAALPLLVYYIGTIDRFDAKRKPLKDQHIGLEVIGTSKSIAEAILIKAAVEILREEGYKDLHVCINSIGDKESMGRFTKELTNYYRKNIEELPSHCRQALKKDVFELLECKNDKCELIKEDAPKSISFLSEPSRQHFKEVLEYLEILGVPYRIHHHLVGDKSFACQTLFEIRSGESSDRNAAVLAIGVRYDTLAKRLGHRRDLPSIGVRIVYKKPESSYKTSRPKKPRIFFIQLGFEAKLRSLIVMEMLRQAKIPIYQSLSRDKLISQLSLAESMSIPYTVIMGQKEALEGTVIVRNMVTRSQDTVPISDLPQYLRRAKF